MIVPMQWAVHTDSAYWQDPLEFRPDRFLTDDGSFFKPESFLPFQSGNYLQPFFRPFSSLVQFLSTTLQILSVPSSLFVLFNVRFNNTYFCILLLCIPCTFELQVSHKKRAYMLLLIPRS